MLAAGPEPGAPLSAVLVLKLKEGPLGEFPERIAGEVGTHLQRSLAQSRVVSVQRGAGRLTLVVALAADDRLRFEKMVAELPAASFSMPIVVESWNIQTREPHGEPSEEQATSSFVLTVKEPGALAAVRLKGVPLKDVLARLSLTTGLQYVCSADAAERPVFAEVKGVPLEEFLRALAVSLGLDLVRFKGFWCLGRRESLRGGGR